MSSRSWTSAVSGDGIRGGAVLDACGAAVKERKEGEEGGQSDMEEMSMQAWRTLERMTTTARKVMMTMTMRRLRMRMMMTMVRWWWWWMNAPWAVAVMGCTGAV